MADPTDRSPDVDRAWFRSQVDPIVGGDVPDAWDTIAARADGTGEAPVPLGADHRRPLAVRWIAAAAAIVVLAGAAVVLATRADDDGSTVTASTPAEATGWYVPTDLPAGWSLESAWVNDTDPGCVDTTRQWFGDEIDGHTPEVELRYNACLDGADPLLAAHTAVPIDGVDGGQASMSYVAPSHGTVRWGDDGQWNLATSELSQDQIVEVTKEIVADPTRADLPSIGGKPSGLGYIPSLGHGPTAVVQVRGPGGQLFSYSLAAPGDGPPADPFSVDVDHPLDGQPNTVVDRGIPASMEMDPPQGLATMDAPRRFVGAWPGADLDVPQWLYLEDGDVSIEGDPGFPDQEEVSQHLDELDVLMASLRPATPEQWQAYLATAARPVTDARLLGAPSLDRLTDPAAASPTTTSPPEPAPTTTVPRATTTAPADPADPSDPADRPISEPATVTSDGEVADQSMYSDLTGLEVQLEVGSHLIGLERPTGAVLVIRNTTDQTKTINECSDGFTRSGIVPRDQPDAELPSMSMIDCYDTVITTIPAGETRRVLVRGSEGGFVARSYPFDPLGFGRLGGTLDGGAYLAIAEIPGSTGNIRVSVPVQVMDPPCPMSDELARRYRDRPLADAKAAAAADGLHLVDAGPDGEGVQWNLDCTRVRAIVSSGNVIDYLLG